MRTIVLSNASHILLNSARNILHEEPNVSLWRLRRGQEIADVLIIGFCYRHHLCFSTTLLIDFAVREEMRQGKIHVCQWNEQHLKAVTKAQIPSWAVPFVRDPPAQPLSTLPWASFLPTPLAEIPSAGMSVSCPSSHLPPLRTPGHLLLILHSPLQHPTPLGLQSLPHHVTLGNLY